MSMREIIWKLRDRLESLLTSLGLSLPGKVMYIGGSDTLPAPLEREAEAELIARLERGDRGARDLLIEHNLRLVAHIIKKAASKRRHLPGKKRPARRGRISDGSPGAVFPWWIPFLP